MEEEKNIEEYYENARRKAKTNIVWFAIFSIIMLFAGLTSAYIVSKGDNFWVSFSMPNTLWISTAIILLSSITMVLAVRSAKKQDNKKTTLLLAITLALGLIFAGSQYYAWSQLYDKGYAWAEKIYNKNTGEIIIDGEYGKDYKLEFQGKELIQEEDGFYFMGQQAIKIDQEEYNDLKAENPDMAFGKEFVRVQENKKNKDKVVLEAIVISKMPLPPTYDEKLKTVGNVSSSYFYVLTILHLAHIIVALFYLFRMVLLSSRRELNVDNQLKIKLGGYFWHFFAGLWVYLLLFLFLIH
ncbi:hypothetical protein N9P38_00890 [Flavobacteriales bacterium]|nr:hypothetical protein [Flavobacteriales bacterium]MDB4088914.1 hypothetical protein [Flavobacteriales bacterium]